MGGAREGHGGDRWEGTGKDGDGGSCVIRTSLGAGLG